MRRLIRLIVDLGFLFWILLVAFVFAVLIQLSPALAHTAPTGWEYHPECCGGNDCAAVPDASIDVYPQGVIITLEKGDHPLAYRDMVLPVLWSEIRLSGDNQWHVCLVIGEHARDVWVSCVYGPMGV